MLIGLHSCLAAITTQSYCNESSTHAPCAQLVLVHGLNSSSVWRSSVTQRN